jgi:hypothetical protein
VLRVSITQQPTVIREQREREDNGSIESREQAVTRVKIWKASAFSSTPQKHLRPIWFCGLCMCVLLLHCVSSNEEPKSMWKVIAGTSFGRNMDVGCHDYDTYSSSPSSRLQASRASVLTLILTTKEAKRNSSCHACIIGSVVVDEGIVALKTITAFVIFEIGFQILITSTGTSTTRSVVVMDGIRMSSCNSISSSLSNSLSLARRLAKITHQKSSGLFQDCHRQQHRNDDVWA